MLHIIELPDHITSIALPAMAVNHIVDFQFVDDIGLLVVLLDSRKILTIDPNTIAVQTLNVTVPTTLPLLPTNALGLGVTMYIADLENLYTLYVDSPADLRPGVPF